MASVAFKNVREDLRTAVSACRCRGLRVSAKWAAELLVHVSDRIEASGSSASSPTAAPPTPVCDDALLAKSYFDLGEYRRAAHALERYRFGRSEGYAAWDASSSSARKPYDATACFLRGYALFLAGEKRKEEERVEQASPLERFAVVNPHLKALDAELRALCVEDGAPAAADGFILYLYAVVLKARERPDEARAALVRAVNANPLIWSAWSDLAALCAEKDVVEALPLNDHWMVSFFRVQALLELQENDGAGMECDKLISIFGESPELVGLSARVEYNLRNFDAAQEKFEELFESLDPYRFEGLETYSNVLYVKEERAKLSHLAHRSLRNSKYRPETCCIIGNYYSLKSMHKRAVVYFKRALRLDRNCLSAWTLMGHEFVELKQTDAAVEAYRRAVDIDPHDFRAWYGLGQTYEIQKMLYYAIFYYRKACTLRPYDARMWVALGGCYQGVHHEKIERARNEAPRGGGRAPAESPERLLAIKCYKRALDNDAGEHIAIQRLGQLFARRTSSGTHTISENLIDSPPCDQDREAAHYMRLYIDSQDGEVTEEVKKAQLYLGQFEIQSGKANAGDGAKRHYVAAKELLEPLCATNVKQTDLYRIQALAFLQSLASLDKTLTRRR